jgi:magnesium transporter
MAGHKKNKKSRPRRRRTRISPPTAPGTSPGTLQVDPAAPKPRMQVVAYGPDGVVEREIAEPGAVREFVGKWPVTWLNIEGLGDAQTIAAVGEIFSLSSLELEDVLSLNQRPKLDDYGDHTFIVMRMPHLEEGFVAEQASLVLSRDCVITFQQFPGDCLDPVRRRIRDGRGSIRTLGADHLAYAIIDATTDSYFPILESLSDRLDELEDEIARKPTAGVLARVFQTKHDLLALRRSIWPQRDILNSLIRDPLPQLTEPTRVYFRDCYDHTLRIMDLVETLREILTNLTEFYQSAVSQRLNEIMKVLTIIATIFIPLTFIVGIYGMNFNTDRSPWNMPELNWYLGYPLIMLIMLTAAVGMLIYFRRKGWIG